MDKNSQTGVAAAGEIPPPDPAKLKRMKIIVTVLGVLILVGIIALIGGIAYKASKMKSRPQVEGFKIQAILPRAAKVYKTILDGDRLLVWVKLDGGDQMIIYNVKKGIETGRIQLTVTP